MIGRVLQHFGYIKKSEIDVKLDFARSVGKRLDEHRELVEAIEKKTDLFSDQWHLDHLSAQDDYLMRLYFMRHGQWPLHSARGSKLQPTGEYVRPRPNCLGECGLPEFVPVNQTKNSGNG